MKALLISSRSSLVAEVLRNLKGTGKDYASSLVVFPGRRPAHFLRKGLAEKVGDSYIPPSVLSMDEFIGEVATTLGSGRKIETIDAVSVLYGIHVKAGQRLGGEGFLTADSFFPLALKIERDIEELLIEDIGFEVVRNIQPFAEETIPEGTAKRLQSLAFFYREFYRELEEKRLTTRSMRYRIAAVRFEEAGFTGRYERVIFAGFSFLTRTEKELFRKLLRCEEALFIFQRGPGMSELLNDLGADWEEKDEESRTDGEVYFYRSPDTHGQVYALSRVIEAVQQRGEAVDEGTAIVLPSSETLFPLLRQGLPILGDSDYNVSLGYPLHRTPVFGFLNNLMELISSMDGNRVHVPAYLKFVLHPYAKNIYFHGRAEITRIMFHALEEELGGKRTTTFLELAGIEGDSDIFRRIMKKMPRERADETAEDIKRHLADIHRNTIGRFLSFDNIGDFAARCMELIEYIFENSTARLHPLFHPFAESFMRSLDLVSGSLMKDLAFSDRTSYFTFLRRYIMTCHTPFEGTPLKGLQVLGFLETRGLKFDRVFIVDANEEVLPDTKKEETLLPHKARRILGLPTYTDRDRLSALYFDNLIGGAKEAHIFFIENDTREKSRFVERLLWERQKRDRTVDPGTYVMPVRYRVKLRNIDPADIEKTPEVVEFLRGFSYSATALDDYLECPLMFYYSYALGLKRKEEVSGGIERADLGKFVHDVISAYFSKRKGFPLAERDVNVREMDALVEEMFSKAYGQKPSGAIYLLGKQVRRRLGELLKKYYLPLVREKNIVILESEERVALSFGGFSLKGRLDSVEKRDDRICIVDYKTGSDPYRLRINFDKLDPGDRDSWYRAIGSLQLPFYLLLYSSKTGVSVPDIDAMFLLLGKASVGRDMELPLFSGDAVSSYGVIKDVIMGLLAEITDPRVPFSPSRERRDSCPACAFRYVCGTQWMGK